MLQNTQNPHFNEVIHVLFHIFQFTNADPASDLCEHLWRDHIYWFLATEYLPIPANLAGSDYKYETGS